MTTESSAILYGAINLLALAGSASMLLIFRKDHRFVNMDLFVFLTWTTILAFGSHLAKNEVFGLDYGSTQWLISLLVTLVASTVYVGIRDSLALTLTVLAYPVIISLLMVSHFLFKIFKSPF